LSDTITGAPAANFIAGRWTPSQSGSVYERHNPWRPNEVVGEFPSSGADDVAAAAAAAQSASREWGRLPAAARGAYLSKAADAIEARQEEIAKDMTREMGSRCASPVGKPDGRPRSCASSPARACGRSVSCSSSRPPGRSSTPAGVPSAWSA
jgi:hypothetical protein